MGINRIFKKTDKIWMRLNRYLICSSEKKYEKRTEAYHIKRIFVCYGSEAWVPTLQVIIETLTITGGPT